MSENLEFKYYRVKDEERNKLLERLRQELLKQEDILFAYVHGSFIEVESFKDLDVAVWVNDPERSFEYSVNLSVKLELKLRVPIDVHVLNEAPLPFKHHVFTRGVLLFSRDEELRAKVADLTLREYIDLLELRRRSL